MSSPIKIAQFNAAGIDKNPDELINFCIQHSIDIILLTETHLAAGRQLNTHWKQHHIFGRIPDNSYKAVDGIALLYRPDFPHHIHIHPHTSDYVISFNMGPYHFHGIYAPPSLDQHTFHNILTNLDINDSTLVFGDLNVRLGSRLGDTRTNGRSHILEDWLLHHGLHIWNETLAFGQFTFEKQGVGNSIIDLFISNTSTFHTPIMQIHGDQSLSSDHHLCTFSFYPALQVPLLPVPNAPRLQWKLQRLEEDPVRTLYVEEFRRLVQPLAATLSDSRIQDHESDPDGIDNFGRQLTEVIYQALDNSVTRGQQRPKSWKWFWSQDLQALADTREAAYRRWRHAPGTLEKARFWGEYVEARDNVRKAVRSARSRSWKQFCAAMQKHDSSTCNSIIKRMRTNRRNQITFSHPQGPAAAVEAMADHLSSVFGGERDDLDMDTSTRRTDQLDDVGSDPFDVDRIIKVIRKEIPARKAPGCDHITGAMLKPIAAPLAQILSPFLRLCWNRSRLPVAWRTAQVVPIYKKDDPTVAANYRPISLTSTFRKIVERCLLPTLLAQMPALDIAQGGFRTERGALDQAFNLHTLMKQHRRTHQADPVVAFLDIKSAYDSVDRSVIWASLNDHLQPALLELLKNMFDDVLITVIMKNFESRTIRPRRGVLQGSILSPILYAVFIDSLPQQLRLGLTRSGYQSIPSLSVSTVPTTNVHESQLFNFDRLSLRHTARRTYHTITVNLLLYADDVAIIGTPEEVKMLLVLAQLHSERYGYRWSPPKCTILNAPPNTSFRLYGQELQRVNHFKYLGIMFNGKGFDVERIVQTSATKGIQSMLLLNSMGAHKYNFGVGVSLRLYRTFVRPVFEYGLAIIHPTATHIKPLERAQDRCIRLAFNVKDEYAHTPTIQAKVMADLPSMKLRAHILEFKFVVRAHELPPTTLLSSVVDTLLRVYHTFNFWANMTRNTMWKDFQTLTRTQPESRHPVKVIVTRHRDKELQARRAVKKSVARMRTKRMWDPILFLPVSTRDRHRLVNWRMHYLPSFPLKDCHCGHLRAHRDHFYQDCPLLLTTMGSLLENFQQTIPDNTHPIDHILNELPRHASGLKKRHWSTTWPLLLQALREIDIATHPQDDHLEQEPEPPPAQALEEFLAEQDAAAQEQLDVPTSRS